MRLSQIKMHSIYRPVNEYAITHYFKSEGRYDYDDDLLTSITVILLRIRDNA